MHCSSAKRASNYSGRATTMNKFQILKRPIITERYTQLREQGNKDTLEEERGANKVTVEQAVESLFNVKVKKVGTMNVHGKFKRIGRSIGRRSDWKRAVVTLAEGQTIELLDQS